MIESEASKVLEYFNRNEELDILDPDGICSMIRFESIVHQGDSLRLDVTLDPRGDTLEDVFTMESSTTSFLDEKEELRSDFIAQFQMAFIAWIKDAHYDQDF